jgi:hypothetical protein
MNLPEETLLLEEQIQSSLSRIIKTSKDIRELRQATPLNEEQETHLSLLLLQMESLQVSVQEDQNVLLLLKSSSLSPATSSAPSKASNISSQETRNLSPQSMQALVNLLTPFDVELEDYKFDIRNYLESFELTLINNSIPEACWVQVLINAVPSVQLVINKLNI